MFHYWIERSTARPPCWTICIGLSCLSVLIATGCGAASVQVDGSDELAKQAVIEILEAWKAGVTPSDFSASHPDWAVADEDWQRGVLLKSFTIDEAAKPNSSHWRQKVDLMLAKKSKGPTTVYYAVTLGRKTSILRSDFLY